MTYICIIDDSRVCLAITSLMWIEHSTWCMANANFAFWNFLGFFFLVFFNLRLVEHVVKPMNMEGQLYSCSLLSEAMPILEMLTVLLSDLSVCGSYDTALPYTPFHQVIPLLGRGYKLLCLLQCLLELNILTVLILSLELFALTIFSLKALS